jgi:ABC-type glycerol-3-phosphate transport system substrate-binding protein
MRRRLIGLVAVALFAAACTAGGGESSTPAQTVDPNAQHAPMTLTVWSNFSARAR